MAVSYEYEPCAGLKAEELVHEELGLAFEKDDKAAIIQGIRANKGRVHLAVGKPITSAIAEIDPDLRSNDWMRALAQRIDQAIHKLYKNWPTNYIAADLLLEVPEYEKHYNQEEKEKFSVYLDQEVALLKGDPLLIRLKLLEIYAGSVLGKRLSSIKQPRIQTPREEESGRL